MITPVGFAPRYPVYPPGAPGMAPWSPASPRPTGLARPGWVPSPGLSRPLPNSPLPPPAAPSGIYASGWCPDAETVNGALQQLVMDRLPMVAEQAREVVPLFAQGARMWWADWYNRRQARPVTEDPSWTAARTGDVLDLARNAAMDMSGRMLRLLA